MNNSNNGELWAGLVVGSLIGGLVVGVVLVFSYFGAIKPFQAELNHLQGKRAGLLECREMLHEVFPKDFTKP